MSLTLQPQNPAPTIVLSPTAGGPPLTLEIPSGPQAISLGQALFGASGALSATQFATSVFVGVGAGQTIDLPGTIGAFMLLVINGVLQSPSGYTAQGSQLKIPPGLVWDGADCFFICNII